MYKDIAGVILAGGKSRRMGFPKQFLTLKSRRVVDNIIDVLKGFFEEILIVTDDKSCFAEIKGVCIAEDIVKDRGPLGGIYTGLKRSSNKRAFFVACDMPFLHNGLIERLLKISNDENLDCIIPRSEKGPEPLHGIYSKNMIPEIEKSLKSGELSIAGMLNKFNCKYVKAEKGELTSFLNINTQEDLEKIKLL
ncbi:MAG: molybdenum cofactor guanylyltransferase [Candidatus Omnitrophota bacterium]